MPLTLPSLFSDHMVLQRSARVPFWGRAEAGDEITVTADKKIQRTTAKADGRWMLELDLHESAEGPFQVVIEGRKSGRVVITDVIVGEVWLASGQSNMEWPLEKALRAHEEIARPVEPRLREFHVDLTSSAELRENVPGRWSVAGPETSGKFSAVGYFFARNLQKELKAPIGIIHSSWGGSRIEAWIAPELLNEAETARATDEHFRIVDIANKRKAYIADYRAWEKKYHREDPGSRASEKFAAVDVSEDGWKPVKLPGKLADFGLPDAGVTWLRKKIVITPAFAHPGMHIHIDTFREFEALYINGELVRETTCESPHQTLNGSRNFHLPIHLRAGEATLAIRLFSPAGDAEISGGSFKIEGEISTDGAWLAKNESELSPISAEAKAAIPQPPPGPPGPQGIPGALYNAMIAPLAPYALAGTIWYQGESNTNEIEYLLYPEQFSRMVGDWRKKFNLPTLPFLYCQLPNLGNKAEQFPRSRWAEFREAQQESLELPHTGMAILLGLGDSADIHPRNKHDVGDRLARLALAKTYGRKIVTEAPRFSGMKIEGGKVRILFAPSDGGLVAEPLAAEHVLRYAPDFTVTKAPLTPTIPGSELQGFAICGENRVWKWAQAKIESDTVLVWSEQVAQPVAVRYAWADNPTCNLFSQEGLPVAPFRTDNFSLAETAKV